MAINTLSPSTPQIDIPTAIIPRLPVSITPKERKIVLAHGQTVTVPLVVRRDEGSIEAIPLKVRNQTHLYPQNGVQLGITATIAEKANEGVATFTAPPNDPLTALANYDYVLAGNIKVNGQDVEVVVPPITVEIARPFTARILTPPGKIHPGDSARLVGVVDRLPPFAGEIKVRIDGLPPTIKAEPITLPPGESVFQFVLVTDPLIELGVINAAVKVGSPMPGVRASGKDYEIPALAAQLEIVARPPVTQPATAPTSSAAAPPAAQ